MAIFVVVVLLLYWHFLGYPLVMAGLRTRFKPVHPIGPLPTVSVVLPVFNEEKNLGPRIDNLRAQDYPQDRIEIIVVESGSTDGTLAEARGLEARVPNLKVVVQESRLGKASAIAAAKATANGTILVISDANTVYDSRTVAKLVEPFEDRRIGGVGGRFAPKNSNDPRAAGSNLYWSLEEIVRAGEAVLDSCCTFHGEVYAWRRDLVVPDITAIIDDLDSAMQIRRKGYRIGYAPDALAFESVPLEVRDMAIQWKKNALGAVQCTLRNWRFLVGSPNYYTYFIFPSHKGLQIIQPFLLLAAATSLLGAVVLGGLLEVGIVIAAFALLSVGSAIPLFLAIRGDSGRRSVADSFFHPVHWVRTFFAFQFAVLTAWKDYLAGKRDVRWEKVESTRV